MLIKCMECGKEISDKAENCIHCGCPINKIQSKISNIQNSNLVCPEFPDDLSIGEKVSGFLNISILGTNESLGKPITVIMHKQGLEIKWDKINILSLHKSQIISFDELTEEEMLSKDKSIIGRAILGGIIFSGVGAVVGGVTGIGKKQQSKKSYYFTINYWDIDTKEIKTIIIKDFISNVNFIRKYKEKVI